MDAMTGFPAMEQGGEGSIDEDPLIVGGEADSPSEATGTVVVIGGRDETQFVIDGCAPRRGKSLKLFTASEDVVKCA